jgi:hypothetical protein
MNVFHEQHTVTPTIIRYEYNRIKKGRKYLCKEINIGYLKHYYYSSHIDVNLLRSTKKIVKQKKSYYTYDDSNNVTPIFSE